jgi:hypothetical protein
MIRDSILYAELAKAATGELRTLVCAPNSPLLILTHTGAFR